MNCLRYYPESYWSTHYLIEQIFLCLIKAKEEDGITRKYEKRVLWLIRRFNIWIPSPVVIIYRKDLSKRIYKELVKLKEESPATLDYVVTRALEMVFEYIEDADEPVFNGNYYLLSVKRNNRLKWRFDKKEDQITDPLLLGFMKSWNLLTTENESQKDIMVHLLHLLERINGGRYMDIYLSQDAEFFRKRGIPKTEFTRNLTRLGTMIKFTKSMDTIWSK